MTVDRPRHTDGALPPYSYVPGHAPHPVSDPAGHMHGEPHEEVAPLRANDWQASKPYLLGVDLFNHGYYWEAHEAWESLWHAVGRSGEMGDFLKGLIKLAATAVKAREGNPCGVERHATRAIELLAVKRGASHCGLDLQRVIEIAEALARGAKTFDQPQPELLLDAVLELSVD